ncbi:MAG TPA: hypothetical protein VJX94_04535 [Stellaceae bacterium]|nr:hypothetical protein [Stellaceae bacterium]
MGQHASRRGVTGSVGLTAIRSCREWTVEHAHTIDRKSVLNAAIVVQPSCCHTI